MGSFRGLVEIIGFWVRDIWWFLFSSQKYENFLRLKFMIILKIKLEKSTHNAWYYPCCEYFFNIWLET